MKGNPKGNETKQSNIPRVIFFTRLKPELLRNVGDVWKQQFGSFGEDEIDHLGKKSVELFVHTSQRKTLKCLDKFVPVCGQI